MEFSETERLLEHQELSFTSRPTYLAMLRQHPQQHSTDVETVLTERGHNRAPLSKRRGDLTLREINNKEGSFEVEM